MNRHEVAKIGRLRRGTAWNSQRDQIIEKALPPEMLSSQAPRGVRRFCPRFYEMGTTDRRTFWAYFFQALASAETGLNPNTSVRHSEPEGAMVMRSEGLLQLSYADQKRRLRFQLASGPCSSRRTIRPKPFSSRRTISNVE